MAEECPTNGMLQKMILSINDLFESNSSILKLGDQIQQHQTNERTTDRKRTIGNEIEESIKNGSQMFEEFIKRNKFEN